MKLLGKAQDPEFWSQTVRNEPAYQQFVQDRLNFWNTLCEGKEILELPYSKFKLFSITGNRNTYENPYFDRRKALQAAAVLALIFPEEQKYLDYAMDVAYAMCNEYTWCIPAHNTKIEKNNNCHLDLFATETGFTLAQFYTILEHRLDPLIKDRIKVELDRRIFTPFTNSGSKFWWQYRGTNNWTAVCIGSIACTTMLMRPELYESYKPLIDPAIERYLSGFGEDGYCVEGIHYWHYGFGFFVTYAKMVRIFTEGAIDYFKLPKVKAVATFLQKMFLSGTAAVSFADGYNLAEYQLGLVHFLKNEYPDDVKVYSPKYSYIEDGCGRFCLVLSAAADLIPEVYENPAADNEPAEYYGEESQWYIKRTDNYGFAAKAGNNNEFHNHNDVGSFIFSKNSENLLVDMGRGEYTQQYFANDTRYGIMECRAKGHSMPYFGDIEQKEGKEFTSTDVKCENGVFTMDIAKAYPTDGIDSLVRTFTTYEDKVVLEDTYKLSKDLPATERIVCKYEPKLEGNVATVGSMKIEYSPESVESIEIVPLQSTHETKIVYYALDFKLKAGNVTFKCTFA